MPKASSPARGADSGCACPSGSSCDRPERIEVIATRKGLSGNQLADLSDIARGYLSEVRAGRKSPTVRTLSKIARALDVSLRDLFS